MKTGIICIETEFEITTKENRRNMDTESLLRFLEEGHQIPYIYRRVATRGELKYYLRKFAQVDYMKRYKILYFSFHGETHCIELEGEKGDNKILTLKELADMGGSVFKGRFVHFSSCYTMLGSEAVAFDFKKETGAKLVSGYSKSVDTIRSAIHDICLFDTFITYTQMPSIYKRLETVYGGLTKELGFKII